MNGYVILFFHGKFEILRGPGSCLLFHMCPMSIPWRNFRHFLVTDASVLGGLFISYTPLPLTNSCSSRSSYSFLS
jgi:hypothetical protein